MKNQFFSKKLNFSNLEIKGNYEERIKKKTKDNKEKMYNQIRKDNKPNKIIEKKINYEKKGIKIAKTMIGGNTLMKDINLNNTNNNSTFIKKEINKKENKINTKGTYKREKNLIIKKILTNQYKNKNTNYNQNNNNNIINKKYKTIYDMYRENKIQNDNKYLNKTIQICKEEPFKQEDNINNINSANTFKCDMNIYLINSNTNDNIIGNIEKIPINRNIVNSRVYSSPIKGFRILKYDEVKNFNNNINNNINNRRAIYKNKNYNEQRNKNSVRTKSCFKRNKCYKKMSFEIKNEEKENNININQPIQSFHKKNDNSFSNNHLILPINEEYNRKINNKTNYLFQNSFNNDIKSFMNKSNNETDNNIKNTYNKIKTKRIIKTSLVKGRFANSFDNKEISNFNDENNINKNDKNIILNKKFKVQNLKEYSNKSNFYTNEDANNNFNKTYINLYQHNQIMLDTMNKKINNKDNNNIKTRKKYFYNFEKELDNYYKNQDKAKINEKINIKSNQIPSLLNVDNPCNINKINNLTRGNKIYCKKNINDKKIDLIKNKKSKTFKKEKLENSFLNNDDIPNNDNKENKEENYYINLENEYPFDEKINGTVNNFHCFYKKIYNYSIIKPKIRLCYINKIKKNKKKNQLSNTSFNLQNISDIENKTLSLKNISKEYPNFELSEMEEKKNSLENDKKILEIEDIEKIDKKSELSSFQKISLGAKKLKDIFEKKKDLEINKKEQRISNYLNANESTKEESNNNTIINKKIFTYKMPMKNKLELEEDNNKIIEENNYSVKNKEVEQKIKFNNSNNNFFSNISNNKSKKKSKSTEKRSITKIINKEIKKENEIEENNVKDSILNDLKNYLHFLEKEKINKKEDIYDGINDLYNWKIIDELFAEKNIKLENIIKIYIDICKDKNFINKDNIFKINEYIKTIIEYYSIDLTKNQKEIIHLNIKEIFNNVDYILNNNDENIYEILGNLLFILLKNKLYFIKDLNHFIGKKENIQINIAKIVKYAIISSGNLSKQYHNDFKYTKLFQNNDIFKNYITKEIYKEEKK